MLKLRSDRRSGAFLKGTNKDILVLFYSELIKNKVWLKKRILLTLQSHFGENSNFLVIG